eukprot:TRINITY_DN4545_c0_g1_i1.p1 TRINITY_DN4545_c0_g1~~TRINITY_DN4545_c0_g1_i1.p1  ORF type:complete len:469 (-),score=122.35 TRINITY_DN4545_c0_g1_i1:182-1588(-)
MLSILRRHPTLCSDLLLRSILPRSSPQILRGFQSLHHPLQGRIPFNLSDIGEGIKEVTIKEWFVKPGDTVKQFDEICEVTSDKASVTISSRYDGVVKKLYYEVDDLAQTGDPLVDIEVESEGPEGETGREILESEAQSAVAESPIGIEEEEGRPVGRKLATPAVRRLAAENNVNLIDVIGSGKGGRILKDDIIAFLEKGSDVIPPKGHDLAAEKQQQPPQSPPKAPPAVIIPPAQADETKPMNPYMRAMVKAMAESLQIPHFVYSDEIRVDRLRIVKKELKDAAKNAGVKLSYMPFLIKAASLALSQYPIINASPDYGKETLLYRQSHNIGIAMDTPNGLLVPNVKNVQALSILEIGSELNRLQDLGKKGKLSSGDLSGGSLTLSNIGSIGGTYMVPVITSGQVAIGAIGSIQTLPRFGRDGSVEEAHIMNLSWSADHRVIDGATVARFSNHMKDMIQSPEKMLLHLK